MKQSEIKKNITDIIRQYSFATGIPEAFIEKDIYVLKVLSALSKVVYPEVKIVFSGGTCLSKAYDKIKRFSEDIDFCIHTSVPFSRKDKSNFRKLIIETLKECDGLTVIEDEMKITDESNFFSFEIKYDKSFESESNLRKNIKAEFKFENLILPFETRNIESMLHQYINDDVVNINCINVVEVAANKFSALLWRSYIKDRSKPLHTKANDPTIMRHLHDISALESEIKTEKFVELSKGFYLKDKSRAAVNDCNFLDFANLVYEKISSDKLFKEEYSNFVETMCYSKEKITFENAMKSFKSIIDYIASFS